MMSRGRRRAMRRAKRRVLPQLVNRRLRRRGEGRFLLAWGEGGTRRGAPKFCGRMRDCTQLQFVPGSVLCRKPKSLTCPSGILSRSGRGKDLGALRICFGPHYVPAACKNARHSASFSSNARVAAGLVEGSTAVVTTKPAALSSGAMCFSNSVTGCRAIDGDGRDCGIPFQEAYNVIRNRIADRRVERAVPASALCSTSQSANLWRRR